ncbi:MAG: hypothetical protein WD009_14870 [Phycisphaeraceae bacterium]
MEFLNRYWAQIRIYLEGLSRAERWLVISLVAVMLLAGSWLVFWASQPDWAPISGFAQGRSEDIEMRLAGYGIETRREGGQLYVPHGDHERAISRLVQDDLLSADTAAAFNDLIERQSPWQTDRQSERAYLIAKQRVLGQIIAKMRGVERADVLISMPQDRGFGRTHVQPSASVTVWQRGGRRVDDAMVDSIARLVAGSVAEMTPPDVSVTDGNHGRTRTVADSDDILPTETLELVQQLEAYHRDKILGVLGYIRDVIVAVNVRVDPVNRTVEEAYDYEEREPLEREEIETITREDVRQGGEPGPQSNVGLDIAGGGAEGMREQIERQTTAFRDKPLILRSHSTRAGHQVEQINVTVNVPRGYFVELFKAGNPDADAPTDADLQPLMDAHLERIRAQVEPLIVAEADGQVQAHMIPDSSVHAATATGPDVGVGVMMVTQWAAPAGVGLLAVVSLALMLLMVRKATQKPELPGVEELSGYTPAANEDELVDEADAPMAGVELDEREVASRRVAEQISDMVKANPGEAGQLLSRWMRRGN